MRACGSMSGVALMITDDTDLRGCSRCYKIGSEYFVCCGYTNLAG